MAKAVVTGGAGFIGPHICGLLCEKGAQVTITPDLSIGKRGNMARLPGRHDVEFIHASITDLSLLLSAFKGADYVFHEAAVPGVPRSIENPTAANGVNVAGTLNGWFFAARDSGVKKVVYASRPPVHGGTSALPEAEHDFPEPGRGRGLLAAYVIV